MRIIKLMTSRRFIMEKLLVFVPAYNCAPQITRVLDQLLPAEIREWVGECIVVNNRSTDDTEEAVKKWIEKHPEMPVSLLRNRENYGLGGSHKVAFGYAINKGFEHVAVLHGDDQGSIKDLLPILRSGEYLRYDCCLGSRFLRDSDIHGYSPLRIVGNYGFNIIYSLTTCHRVTDIGSGLNLYATEPLRSEYWKKLPDTIYFNACILLSQYALKMKIHYFPITWREDDQVSNAKLWNLSVNLLRLCGRYIVGKKKFVKHEWRSKIIDSYESDLIEGRAN